MMIFSNPLSYHSFSRVAICSHRLGMVLLVCAQLMGPLHADEPLPGIKNPAEYGGLLIAGEVQPDVRRTRQLRQKLEELADPKIIIRERRFMAHFENLCRAERYRVHLICQLSPAQRQQLKQACDRFLADVVHRYCIAVSKQVRGDLQNLTPLALNPQRLLRLKLAQWIRDQLGPAMAQTYSQANQLSQIRRQQVTIMNLVAVYDRWLLLTSEQRDELTKNLTTHWQSTWELSLPQFIHGSSKLLPNVPDRVVLPTLTPTQKIAWHDFQPTNRPRITPNRGIFGQGFGAVIGETIE